MERETILTGYCRQLDKSRMVVAVAENGELTEVDCCYESCIHTAECTVAQKLRDFLRE
jgi:hypothetical protein